jgi:hypothetical protein
MSPDHELTLIERGTDVHLNHPITAQRGTHDSRLDGSRGHLTPCPAEARRRGVWTIRRARPDRLEWAQAQGLDARLHLLDMRRTQTSVDTCAWHRRGRLKHCRCRLKLTPCTLANAMKNLAGAPTLLQGFGGYTRGCASAPPRNSTATRREEHPISEHQPLRVPNKYHRRGTGATVGDSHNGPLITGGKPISSQNNKNTNELTNRKLRLAQSRPGDKSPRP